MIKSFIEAEVKTVDEQGSFEVIASSGKTDRMGDKINPGGWYLTNYKKNPVILWSHSSGGFGGTAIPPIGKADKVWVENGKELKVKGHFADTPFAQELKTLVEGGFLNAVSVGFLPLVEDTKGSINIDEKMYRRATDDEIKKGIYDNEYGQKFDKQELLELSWVSVPALPQALVSARKMNLGLVTKALEEMETIQEEEKGVIAFKSTPKAPESDSWSASTELKKAKGDAKKLKLMHTWVDSSADGYNADESKWYKLPHHKGDGNQAVVWRGVSAAMGALLGARGGVKIPDSDRKGVYNHLVKHYKEFDKEPPKFKEYTEAELKELFEEEDSVEERLDRIENSLSALGEAIISLKGVDPGKEDTPDNDTKGRKTFTKAKRKKSETERMLIRFDKMLEILLKQLRQQKNA